MSQSSESRDGHKWPDSRYILKGGPRELADRIDESMKEKEESCVTSRLLTCTNGRIDLPLMTGVGNMLDSGKEDT